MNQDTHAKQAVMGSAQANLSAPAQKLSNAAKQPSSKIWTPHGNKRGRVQLSSEEMEAILRGAV